MKAILICLFFIYLGLDIVHGQTQSPSSKIKDKYFFLYLDGKQVKYFLSKPDGAEPIKNTVFPLAGTYSNIYMKWLNPLRYSVVFQDTVAVDQRDAAIKEFVTAMQAQFGTNSAMPATKAGVPGDGGDKIGKMDIDKKEIKTPVEIATFRNPNLLQLYTVLRINQQKFTDSTRKEINRVGKILEELDAVSVSFDISGSLNTYFGELYSIQDPAKVAAKTKDTREKLKTMEETFKKNENLQFTVDRELKTFDLKNEAEQVRFKDTILAFLELVKKNLSNDRALAAKVPPVLEIMDNSIKNPSVDQPGYFPVKSVSFDEGNSLKTTLTVTEKEYKAETKSFTEKEELVKANMKFERYDVIGISLSTGVFYGSTDLKGYGVSNDNNEFTVTEDNISKGNVVTALFLNFTFNSGSRYLLPFFQLGIDPTKKRPFLMAGGGLRIPSSKFGISGGPLWTWNQSLDKLTVGQKIVSTTDLEKDIKYKFDSSPKGWYLGLQYSF